MLIPPPRLCFADAWEGPCSAVFCLKAPGPDLIGQAASTDTALIAPYGESRLPKGIDGLWSANVREIKTARKRLPDAQLVALAQDRHSAMMMGEAGADLILFGGFDRLALGDLDLAIWWAELFEVPCACLITPDAPTDQFGQPGHPEFYLKLGPGS